MQLDNPGEEATEANKASSVNSSIYHETSPAAICELKAGIREQRTLRR